MSDEKKCSCQLTDGDLSEAAENMFWDSIIKLRKKVDPLVKELIRLSTAVEVMTKLKKERFRALATEKSNKQLIQNPPPGEKEK